MSSLEMFRTAREATTYTLFLLNNEGLANDRLSLHKDSKN